MRCQPGEQRSGSRVAKPDLRCRVGGRKTQQPQACHQERMSRQQGNGREELRRQLAPVLGKGSEQPPPPFAVFAESPLGFVQIALQDHSRAIVHRMGQRCRRLDPFQAVLFQWQAGKKWRAHRHGMNRRAEVVQEAGKSERKCSCAAAGLRFGLVNLNLQARLGQNDGRRQAIGTCSDDHGAARGGGHRDSLCETASAGGGARLQAFANVGSEMPCHEAQPCHDY